MPRRSTRARRRVRRNPKGPGLVTIGLIAGAGYLAYSQGLLGSHPGPQTPSPGPATPPAGWVDAMVTAYNNFISSHGRSPTRGEWIQLFTEITGYDGTVGGKMYDTGKLYVGICGHRAPESEQNRWLTAILAGQPVQLGACQ